MKRFVVPPTWPSPPRRSWVPPKTWHPDPSWPPPPDDWKFWVDGKGKPVRGPIGLYAGTSRRIVYAGVAALVLFLGVNVWALTATGLFGGDSGDPQAVQIVDDRASTPSATPTLVVPQVTTPPPVPRTTATPTQKPTSRPTQQPTKTRTTARPTEQRPDPTPTKTKKTPKPPRPTVSQPPTREEILRQYCVQQGWDPEWCDPDNWPKDPADDPRNGP